MLTLITSFYFNNPFLVIISVVDLYCMITFISCQSNSVILQEWISTFFIRIPRKIFFIKLVKYFYIIFKYVLIFIYLVLIKRFCRFRLVFSHGKTTLLFWKWNWLTYDRTLCSLRAYCLL